jgi:hypothetical protein
MAGVGSEGDAVDEDAIILRYVDEGHISKKPGQSRPTSDLYRCSTDGSGTSAIAVCADDKLNEVLARHPEFEYWRRIDCKSVLAKGLTVIFSAEDDEPQHCLLQGWPDKRKDKVKIEEQLRNESDWYGEPPPIPE